MRISDWSSDVCSSDLTGAHVDMALLDSQGAVLANQAANYLASGAVPKRMGNAHVNVVPYQVFATADGQLVIAVGNDGQYRRLCAILGEIGRASCRERVWQDG